MALQEAATPELLRSSLEDTALQAKAALPNKSIHAVLSSAIDAPRGTDIDASVARLRCMGALDSKERLTPLGAVVAKLPLDAINGRLAFMGALLDCLAPALIVSAAAGNRCANSEWICCLYQLPHQVGKRLLQGCCLPDILTKATLLLGIARRSKEVHWPC